MTDRLTALAAAVLLAVTLAACGEADNKKPGTAPDTTPNGGVTTQPDTNGTDGGAEARRYDRALAAAMYQLITNRLEE